MIAIFFEIIYFKIMRKICISIVISLLLLSLLVWIGWESKTTLAAHFISKHLHVPTTIQSLNIAKTRVDLSSLWIGNPRHSKTPTSFSAKTIEIEMNTSQVLKDPLIIDRIDISNIFVGLEYYENGDTNWNKMLGDSPEKSEGRGYLIRTLVLENLTVEVTQANGQKKRYPTIQRMEFHNISNETGIPIKEIEKAIFKLMMKNIMDKYNLFKPLNLPNSPLKYLPGLFN